MNDRRQTDDKKKYDRVKYGMTRTRDAQYWKGWYVFYWRRVIFQSYLGTFCHLARWQAFLQVNFIFYCAKVDDFYMFPTQELVLKISE
jgi:hypothetical protein